MVLVEYKWMLKNIYGEDKGPTKGGGASGNNHKNLESEKRRGACLHSYNKHKEEDQSINKNQLAAFFPPL